MHKHLSRGLSRKSTSPAQVAPGRPWDEAIQEAENQITQVQSEAVQKIARLTESKQTLVALRDSGAAFPGESANKEIAA
jgi:hypothetical protein